MLICVTAVEECDARDDDSSSAVDNIIYVFMFLKLLRPDFIGIPLRFTRDDDSSNEAGFI